MGHFWGELMGSKRLEENARNAAGPFVDDYFPYLLARASHLVSSPFHKRLTKAGLSIPVWRVLCVLYDRDSLFVGELAEMVLLKQPTLSKVLDRMISDGFVIRSPSAGDRRRVHVEITPHGRQLVQTSIDDALAQEARVLSGFTTAEISTLKSVLRELITRLEAD